MIYMGVTDTAYARAVGRKWMVQAVARVYRPGCKADHALILEGPQGAFKSTACTVIAMSPDWFADEIADLGSKDSAQDLRGKWIIEIGELSAMRRSEVERVKAFISRCIDHYRPSYGRRSQDFPRSCVLHRHHQRRRLPRRRDRRPAVLAGQGRHESTSTNCAATSGCCGPRRSSPSRPAKLGTCRRTSKCRRARQQADRRIADPWEQAVITWATDKNAPVTIAEVLHHAIGLELERRDQVHENRVARIFKAHGWERVQLRVAGDRVWHYRRPPHVAEPTAEQVESSAGSRPCTPCAGRRASPLSPVASSR